MIGIICFAIGVLVGCLAMFIGIRLGSGRGYFYLEKYPEEEGFYTVNIRIDRDMNLLKKKRIILTREYDVHISQK